jgi:hypothetical protein
MLGKIYFTILILFIFSLCLLAINGALALGGHPVLQDSSQPWWSTAALCWLLACSLTLLFLEDKNGI